MMAVVAQQAQALTANRQAGRKARGGEALDRPLLSIDVHAADSSTAQRTFERCQNEQSQSP